MKKTFRCTYSEKGTEWLRPQNPYRTGDAYKSGKYTRVRWDENKTFSSYHPSFIQNLCDDDIYEDGSGWDWDFYCYAMMNQLYNKLATEIRNEIDTEIIQKIKMTDMAITKTVHD